MQGNKIQKPKKNKVSKGSIEFDETKKKMDKTDDWPDLIRRPKMWYLAPLLIAIEWGSIMTQ